MRVGFTQYGVFEVLSSFFSLTICCASIQTVLCTNSHDLSGCQRSLSS